MAFGGKEWVVVVVVVVVVVTFFAGLFELITDAPQDETRNPLQLKGMIPPDNPAVAP